MLKLKLLILLVGAVAVSSASTLIYTVDVFSPGQTTPSYGTGSTALTNSQLITDAQGATLYNTTAAGISTFVELPQFDDLGGTLILDSVQIVMGWATVGTVSVINSTGSTASYTSADANDQVTVTPPGPFVAFPVAAFSAAAGGTVPAGTVHTTGQNQTSCTNSGHIWNGTTCIFYTAATATATTTENYGVAPSSILTSGLGNFLGGSTVTLNILLGQGTYSGVGGAGVSFGAGSTSVGGVFEIVYNFHEAEVTDPTPEPATMVLMGGALVGIALLRRRRSAPLA